MPFILTVPLLCFFLFVTRLLHSAKIHERKAPNVAAVDDGDNAANQDEADAEDNDESNDRERNRTEDYENDGEEADEEARLSDASEFGIKFMLGLCCTNIINIVCESDGREDGHKR